MDDQMSNAGATGAGSGATFDPALVTETLVEEVFIDGMCGVY